MKTDPNVMNISTGKNTIPLNSDTTRYAIWCYGTRFIPTGIILIICHALTIAHLLKACSEPQTTDEALSNITLPVQILGTNQSAFDDIVTVGDTSPIRINCSQLGSPDTLAMGWMTTPQLSNFVAMFVYFTVVSLSFLSRRHQLWQRHPGI